MFPAKGKKNLNKEAAESISRKEVFAKLNARTERILWALQQAYETGLKEGIGGEEEDRVIDLLCCAKKLRDEMCRLTSEPKP